MEINVLQTLDFCYPIVYIGSLIIIGRGKSEKSDSRRDLEFFIEVNRKLK